MKKFNLRLLAIFLAISSITLLSCDDENNSDDNVNYFKYDGITYNIESGFLNNNGIITKNSQSTYNLSLAFFTSGISYNSSSGEVSGNGSYLFFEIFSTSSNQLNSGTYTFDLTESLTAGTFDYAEAGINFNFSSNSGTLINIKAGTLAIDLSDSNYEITINLTTSDDKQITGFFRGSLTPVYLLNFEIKNSFKYDGKFFRIANGFLENYGAVIEKSVASYNLDLTFATSGITYNTETGDISGIGSLLYFEMFTTSETQLVPGTYSFDLYETTNTGTFDYAELAINYNFATETGTYVDFVAGTIVVKLTDTTYEITINLTSTENKVLTGYFKGTLTYVDLTQMITKSPNTKFLKK